MRKVTAIILGLTLSTSSVFADNASREEKAGVGAGAVIGALAGGPVGFIIGAAIGAKIGDSMDRKNTSIDALTGSLDDSRKDANELEHDVQALNRDIDSLSAELQQFREIDRPGLVNLMQAGIAMDLLFRTDEHVLADTTGGRLAELARGVSAMSDIRVQLDREQLISAGIHPSRISVIAHGEAPAQDKSADSYALERRVSLKLFIEGAQPFASSPN